MDGATGTYTVDLAGVGATIYGAAVVVDLTSLPDAALVSIGAADRWVDTPSLRHVATPSEAYRLLARRGPTWVRRHGATLQCEIEQYEAARVIGVADENLCVRVTWLYGKPAGRLTRRWYGADPELLVRHRGAKIAIAAIYGAPRHPTSFDVQRIAEFGYGSVSALAERIARWNDSNESKLPMPLSTPN